MGAIKLSCCVAGLSVFGGIAAPFIMPVMLTLFRYYGRECRVEDYEPFQQTGVAVVRQRLDEAKRTLLREVMETEVPADSRGYCGVDCSSLGEYAKFMRSHCKMPMADLARRAPHVIDNLKAWLGELGLPETVEDPHFVPMHSPSKLNATGLRGEAASSPLLGWLLTLAPRYAPLLLSIIHQTGDMYDHHTNSRICSETPELCQGFPWHIDDEELAPMVINRLYALIDKVQPRRANLRIVPRGAYSQWTLEATLTREFGVRSPWLLSTARAAFERLRAAYIRMMGEAEAAWWIRQLRFSLAGCTAVMEPGDVLLFSSDIYHMTQGTEADRLTIILSSCENCHTPEGQGPKIRSTRFWRDVTQGISAVYRRMIYGGEEPTFSSGDEGEYAAAYEVESTREKVEHPLRNAAQGFLSEPSSAVEGTACEPWCVNSCAELNGNVAAECNGCSSGCHPGAPDFPQV